MRRAPSTSAARMRSFWRRDFLTGISQPIGCAPKRRRISRASEAGRVEKGVSWSCAPQVVTSTPRARRDRNVMGTSATTIRAPRRSSAHQNG